MKQNMTEHLFEEALALLKELIATPSPSKDEYATATLLQSFLSRKGIAVSRFLNNVWAVSKYYDAQKPTLLLNSHHDTVKPNNYTLDPFDPKEDDRKLYGLGSNDAGGCLVSLLAVFLHFYDKEDMRYNLVFAASAEEEISGVNGISALLPCLPEIDCAIVGEPTQMNMAVAEKGLLVLDCVAEGIQGHAASDDGRSAIYRAMKDIEWLSTYKFPKASALLGPVKMNVTMINAGTQHNVVPGTCSFTVDCRINECYTHEEVLAEIRKHLVSTVTPRSTRLRSTAIAVDHPLVAAGTTLGRHYYGSPTLSDKALMPFPALKMGPGDSARSHMADEFIYVAEIKEGIDIYIQLLNSIL